MDVSDILYFFCSGEGKGESRATGKRFVFFLKIPGGGGVSQRGGGESAESVCGEFLGGGGLIFFFFRGRNVHQA